MKYFYLEKHSSIKIDTSFKYGIKIIKLEVEKEIQLYVL